MSIAALVRRMAELGAPAEAIALAVEAIEAEQAKDTERKARRAEQKARERASKREHVARQSHDNAATVAPLSQDPSSPLAPPSFPPTPPNQPPYNPPTNQKPPKAPKGAGQAYSDAFERFWAVYPKRDGSNPKAPAFGKFATKVRGGADPEEIVAGALAYAHDMRGKDAQFVAQAVTWLNQERWNDHRPTAPPNAQQRLTLVQTGPPVLSPEEVEEQMRQAGFS